MKFSTVDTIQKSRDFYRGFGGYNNTYSAKENEFEDMLNMSMDDYPYIKTRKRRGLFDFDGKNLFGADKLVFTKIRKEDAPNRVSVYYNGVLKISGTDDNDKKFAIIGNRVVVWPEKVIFSEENIPKSLEWKDTPDKFQMGICKKDGSIPAGWSIADASDTELSNPSDKTLWIDTDSNVLRQYNESTGDWQVLDAYTYIYTTRDYRDDLKEGDKITISGAAAQITSDYDIINGDYTVVCVTKKRIVVSGVFPKSHTSPITSNTTIKITRPVPDMDYICACGNRLWGCNSANNEIYCSALGDPSRFYTFTGVSTDSYAATLGTLGEFTGCAAYRGNVLFFKEDYIHVVTGSYPAQFQITEIHCRGVQKGSWASITLVNETLFYKSNNAVMAYTGGLPYSVSESLDGEKFSEAVAGAIDDKLYLCMKNELGKYWLYTYDTKTGIWCKEDNIHIVSMAYAAAFRDLFFRDSEGNTYNVRNTSRIFSYGEEADQKHSEEQKINFSLTTAKLFLDNINKTYVNGLKIRVKLEPGTKIHIDIQYDGKEWNNVHNSDKFGEYVISIPLLYRSCDYCKVRISGRGEFTLMGLAKSYSEGNNA